MTQAPVLSSSGMYSNFRLTRVLRTVELDYTQILRALDSLQLTKPFNKETLVLVDKVEQRNGSRIKQTNILKGVLLSNELYQTALLANPLVVPFISETKTSDDFFIPDDRLSRAVPKLAPSQTRKTLKTVIPVGGVVNVGVPFVDATLTVSPVLVPTGTSGTAGTVTFALIDVGTEVVLSYVTQAIHPTLLITRQESQSIKPSLVINNYVLAVIMNPTLAGLLGLTLPLY